MNNKILTTVPVLIVVVALVLSMYMVFDRDTLVASNVSSEAKKYVAGAYCPANDASLSDQVDEIQFVGCGGFF